MLKVGRVGDAWKYIRDIQRGRQPTKPKAIFGILMMTRVSTPTESLQRWQQHFKLMLF